MPKTTKNTKLKYTFAVGRRKEAVARVRLYSGKGLSLVSEKPIEEYFPGEQAKILYLRPLMETNSSGKYYFTAKVAGGGKHGQLEALVHALSRALALEDKDQHRSLLKKRGLLTRDSRTRERRKVGTGGKARRKKQSPKR